MDPSFAERKLHGGASGRRKRIPWRDLPFWRRRDGFWRWPDCSRARLWPVARLPTRPDIPRVVPPEASSIRPQSCSSRARARLRVPLAASAILVGIPFPALAPPLPRNRLRAARTASSVAPTTFPAPALHRNRNGGSPNAGIGKFEPMDNAAGDHFVRRGRRHGVARGMEAPHRVEQQRQHEHPAITFDKIP